MTAASVPSVPPADPLLLLFVLSLIGIVGMAAVCFGLADLYRHRVRRLGQSLRQAGEPDAHYRQRTAERP